MRIHKMFNGSYLDLDHVIHVSELIRVYDSDDLDEWYNWMFRVDFFFREKPIEYHFDWIALRMVDGNLVGKSDDEVEKYCRSVYDEFIKTWGLTPCLS